MVIVHYFASLREQKNCAQENCELETGDTVGQLYDRLFPANESERLPVAFAVNQTYVQGEHLLRDGDEVAFIPPIGGG
jgi:molybdopterin converting factor subunit 1